VEEGTAEVGELGAEGGERVFEISHVLHDVVMAPAMVVVMAAQLAVLQLDGGWRHCGGSRHLCLGSGSWAGPQDEPMADSRNAWRTPIRLESEYPTQSISTGVF
jgi:hypothetical protein